jgi:S1-C subfamily serine protease
MNAEVPTPRDPFHEVSATSSGTGDAYDLPIAPIGPSTHDGPAADPRSGGPAGQQPSSSGPAARGGRILPVVLTASVLSALLASAATAGVVLVTRPDVTTPAASATTASAASTSSKVTIESSDAVVQVAASASPAVVTITTQGMSQGFGPFSVPSTGVGSGFIFESDGLILTNYHVVEGADQLVVTLQDGTELTGRVVASDQTHDLAVVKVDGSDLPTIPIGSSASLAVGQLVVAIGSPLGTFTETVTSGILSGTGRTITVAAAGQRNGQTLTDLLQTDAAINEGNSGGPLLDAAGQAIGINTAVASSAEGIGFATPIDTAAALIAQARAASGASS